MNKPTSENLLPFLLRRENIVRYESGKVIVGNRKDYPFKKSFIEYEDVEGIGSAIKNMITQGGGQWIAAGYALAMEARRLKDRKRSEQKGLLKQAALFLIDTRPTNTTLARRLNAILNVLEADTKEEEPLEDIILQWVNQRIDDDYASFETMGRWGTELINTGDGILTMCFAEMSFLYALTFAHQAGKKIKVYVPETRPYLQGARLTAPSIHELGIPVELICDNMPAYLLSQGKIQKYFTAADLVTMDGHVVNKVGSFQNAVCAHYHKTPYFVFCRTPDKEKQSVRDVKIEERNPDEIKLFNGAPTTIPEINAYYPAFDITPPHLVSAIITEKGLINPYYLKTYFA